jgi:putative colanic acid biosynthesis glycosyltransferase WcaI
MHILLLTPNYYPDLGPSAPLFGMLAENLVQRGHDVTVITAVPNYPSGQIPAEYRGKSFWRSQESGVQVIRVNLPSIQRQSLPQRLFQFIIFQIGALLAGLSQRYDVAIITNPALQVWLPFFWLVVLRRIPAVYSVHDLYPDVGVKLGIFKTKYQIGIVSWLERYCLDHARYIRVLSDSFVPNLMRLGVPKSKVAIVYDWVDTALIQALPRDNSFTNQYDLHGKFVVLYAGNIGLSQGLEQLLEVAELLKDDSDIQFVFVGDGSGKAALEEVAWHRRLPNVQFIPFQPRQSLPEVLASAAISIVLLKRDVGISSLPSKIFSIMASCRPILISVDEESEAWSLINKAQAGIWVPPEDPSQIANAILKLKNDPKHCDQLGRNGRTWVEQHHSPQYAAEQFESLLRMAIQTRDG